MVQKFPYCCKEMRMITFVWPIWPDIKISSVRTTLSKTGCVHAALLNTLVCGSNCTIPILIPSNSMGLETKLGCTLARQAFYYLLRDGRTFVGKPFSSSETNRRIPQERLSGPPRWWQLACSCDEFKNRITISIKWWTCTLTKVWLLATSVSSHPILILPLQTLYP